MRKSLLVVWAAIGTALNAFSQAAPPATPQPTPPVVQQAPAGRGPQTTAPAAGQPSPAGRGGFNMAGPPRPAPPPPYTCDPVNPNTTPEARALLKTLCAVSGKGTLSGQHNFPNQRSQDTGDDRRPRAGHPAQPAGRADARHQRPAGAAAHRRRGGRRGPRDRAPAAGHGQRDDV